MTHTRISRSLLATAMTLCLSAPAFAQSDDNDLVIVTAQKREQSLQDVPASLDVIRGDELDAISSGGEDILFLSSRVPSLYAESSFGRTFPRFYVRGLGNTDFDLNANQPVSLVYDGVVLENPVLKGFPVFDLDRIEVLRGPQGTLFGRNTPAGVVKFESAKPTEETEGYVRGAYGRFDTVDLEGAVSGALADGITARLSGLYQSRGEVVDNTVNLGSETGFEDFDEFAGRLQVQFDPSDNASILLNLHGRDLSGGSRTFRANAFAQGSNDLVDSVDRFEAAQDAIQELEVSNFGASVKGDFQIGGGTLTTLSAYETVSVDARGDVDGGFGAVFAPPSGPGFIPFAAESADNITDHAQLSQEIRFNTDIGERVNATIGGYAFYENLELVNLSYDTLAGSVENGRAVQDQETTSLALFGSAEIQATEKLIATVGLRLTSEDKDFVASRILGPFGAPALGPIERNLSDTVVTGDIALNYELNDQVNLYSRYSRGFRAPNVQGRLVFGDVVTVADTEIIDSIEAGFKSRILNGLGTFNANAYYFETKDQQLTAVGGAGNFNQLLNADSVRGQGIEVDASFNPIKNFDLTAGFSINDTEIIDADLTTGACGAACTILDPVDTATGLAFIDGNPLPQAPRFIANAAMRYAVPVSDDAEVFFSGDVAHRSKVNFFLYESEEFNSDSLTEVGIRAGYATDGYEVAGYVRNLFGALEAEGAVDFNNFTAFINEPTIWAVEVTKRF